MRNFKYKLLWLMLIPICISSFSQSNSEDYYYYKGEKLFTILDFTRIAISFEGTISENELGTLLLDSKWIKIHKFRQDHIRQTVHSVTKEANDRKNILTFYCEILTNDPNPSDYAEKFQALKSIPGVSQVTKCYIANGSNPIGLTNNFYVRLKTINDLVKLKELANKNSIEILGRSGYDELLFVLTCGRNTVMNAMQSANLFFETKMFEYAEPAFSMYFERNTNDPNFGAQWLLKNTGQNNGVVGVDIGAEDAWTITKGDPSIWTAVIDDGIETNHPDLQNNISNPGWDGPSNTGPAQVYGNHGTACAGIISAQQNNNIGLSGVAPLSKIYPVSINYSGLTPMDIHNSFYTIAQNIGAHVISCSWGGGSQSNVIDGAITYALTVPRNGKGIVVVFSSGNGNNSNGEYPANSNPDILVVGGIDRCGFRSGQIGVTVGSCDPWCPICRPGSSFGTSLDVVAGGSVIFTTDRQGVNGETATDYDPDFGGTSAACPAVAGVASLMMSVFPDMTRQDVNFFICYTAKKLSNYFFQNDPGHTISTWNNETGYGLVDAYQAVLFASELNCNNNQNVNITTNVTAPLDKIKSAANTINALSIVNSGAKAIYRAGDEVRLNIGFDAVSGCTFRAYNQGCAGGFQFRQSNNSDEVETAVNGNISLDKLNTNTEIKIVPNPNNGYFKFILPNTDNYPLTITVTDLLGRVVSEISRSDSKEINFDLSEVPSGIYIVKANYNGTLITNKIIKN